MSKKVLRYPLFIKTTTGGRESTWTGAALSRRSSEDHWGEWYGYVDGKDEPCLYGLGSSVLVFCGFVFSEDSTSFQRNSVTKVVSVNSTLSTTAPRDFKHSTATWKQPNLNMKTMSNISHCNCCYILCVNENSASIHIPEYVSASLSAGELTRSECGYAQCCTWEGWALLWGPAGPPGPFHPPDTPDISAAAAGTSSAVQEDKAETRPK